MQKASGDRSVGRNRIKQCRCYKSMYGGQMVSGHLYRKDRCVMVKKKSGYVKVTLTAIVCWLAFIWLRTFNYMSNYETLTGSYGFLIIGAVTLGLTLFYWWCFQPDADCSSLISILLDDDDDEMEELFEECGIDIGKRWSILHKSMLVVCVLSLLCLLGFAFEMWTDITVFTDATYIHIGIFTINKKYMFDPLLFLVFPIWTQCIFRGIREEGYNVKSVFSASVQLIVLSLISFLLFMKFPNIWLIELAVIESIVIIGAIKKYVWKQCSGKKGNTLALFGAYELFWCSLLAVFYHSGMTISQYTYGNSWGECQANVRTILGGAATLERSAVLSSNQTVLDFLTNRNNYLLASIYYGGWAAAVAVIAVLVVFLFATRRMLGNHAVNNRNHLLYTAAWWTLALRVVLGIPYSLGILAMPVALPFAGEIGLYMDTIALGLLIWAAFEAEKIDKSFYKDRMVADVVGGNEVQIEEEDETFFELLEMVRLTSGDYSQRCFAEKFDEEKILVLEPVDSDESGVFIVERHEETGKWHDVEDAAVRANLLLAYSHNNMPDCMEVVE